MDIYWFMRVKFFHLEKKVAEHLGVHPPLKHLGAPLQRVPYCTKPKCTAQWKQGLIFTLKFSLQNLQIKKT